MKKLLSIIMVALMARAAFAFVPLTNSQLNIGSYQRGATRGMFYNELDIVSAAPVELLDFSGNTLYTNWGNVRNFNDIGNYGTALDWSQYTGNTDISYFTFGVTGNPLSYAGIDDSRSGIVYQNYGGKTTTYDLDNAATVANDSEGKWTADTYTVVYPTLTVNDQTNRATSDAKYYTNTTNTQWNIGSSYKLMDKVSLGLSLARQTDTNILTTEGTKTFSETYLTPTGANTAGRPVTATERRSYNFAYPTQEIDQNSTATTDILPQARVKISDDLHVDVGVGLRSAKTLNPNTLVADEKTTVTVTAREDVLFSTSAGIGVANSGQYFNTGTAIVGKTAVAAVQLDYNAVANIGPNAGLNSNVFNSNRVLLATTDDSGISAFADDRDGIAPLVRIEAVKKFEKVEVTGIVNYSNLSQDIDASQTDREYLQTSCVISTWVNTSGNGFSNGSITDNFVAKDYTNIKTFKGKGTISNFDLGAKVSMKALEGVKLSFGGFILKQTDKTDVDTTGSSTELTSYSDGLVSTNVYNNGTAIRGSSGTFVDPFANPTNPIVDRPGPIAGTDQSVSRGGIETSGEGEGSWLQTISDTGQRVTETVTLSYSVPVGIEIPLSKKWTFRAGTEYVMTKTETTTERTTNQTTQTTVATPVLGETAQASTTETALTGPSYTKSTIRTEDHDVFYTYGVQFDATPSLTIACNAFLDTATDTAVGNASIFDLNTYRQLSLSAAIKF
ncbi:MAG: hypothetical protein HY919_06355 [Elusimicrobia bacterium]|nr:hypothetical protein [Elusimicrobiota bacterium]